MFGKKKPDVDPKVFGTIKENLQDVVEDTTVLLPPESEAQDVYYPPAP